MISDTRIKTIVYAEGFIEDFIESSAAEINQKENATNEKQQAAQLLNMWQVLSTGLTDMRKEFVQIQNKLAAVRAALE